MPIENLGANIDTRSAKAKQKDFSFVEAVVSAAPVIWVEKPELEWRKFPVQDQHVSGSCVAQTVKKLALILLWLKEKKFEIFSATSIYQSRSNKPAGGMIGVEAFDIWKDQGIGLESMVPSEKLTDGEMDAIQQSTHDKEVAKAFTVAGHLGIPNMDFETVASVIQVTGKGVMSWFYFTRMEWSRLIPIVIEQFLELTGLTTARHSITIVDYFLYRVNGNLVKVLLAEDSAHFSGYTQHLITEDFFKARNWFTRYPMNFKYQDQSQPVPTPTPVNPKPTYKFTKPLEFIPLDVNGNISDFIKNEVQKADMTALQNILKYEGLFPQNIASTGYYGAITARAIYNYQVRHAVAPLSELDAIVPKGGRVGNKTINNLNALYEN